MRYFIAYNVEGVEREILDKLREELAEKFEVRAALAAPAHLTLFPPFELEDSGLECLKDELKKIAERVKSFEIETAGFNYFGQAVWYVDVEQKLEMMNLKDILQEMMKVRFSKLADVGRGTHFHVTLAYKDLTPEKFKLMGDFLAGQTLSIKNFKIDSISLLGLLVEKWQVVEKFNLSA